MAAGGVFMRYGFAKGGANNMGWLAFELSKESWVGEGC